MSSFAVPVDSMVPISTFNRGGASAAFAKVADGHPVTVLRNNKPTYFIFSEQDAQRYHDLKEQLAELMNAEARRQVKDREYTHTFTDLDEMESVLNAL